MNRRDRNTVANDCPESLTDGLSWEVVDLQQVDQNDAPQSASKSQKVGKFNFFKIKGKGKGKRPEKPCTHSPPTCQHLLPRPFLLSSPSDQYRDDVEDDASSFISYADPDQYRGDAEDAASSFLSYVDPDPPAESPIWDQSNENKHEASSNLELHRWRDEQVDPIMKGFIRLDPQQQIPLATTSYALCGQALVVADAAKNSVYQSTQDSDGAVALEEEYYQAEEKYRISKTRILRLLSHYARHGQDHHYETLADQVVTLEAFYANLEPYFTRRFGLDPACTHRQATAALR